jgi:ribulose-phosphate 3-epimerase
MDAGSDWVSFHIEIEGGTEDNIAMIKERGLKAGLVLNPDTDVERVFPYLEHIDYVLLMSVFPGYGGQKFIPETVNRVAQLKKQVETTGTECLIQVDGGINATNAKPLSEAGADLFVIGTFLFNSKDIGTTIHDVLISSNKAVKGRVP